ncbi:MAG TPA: hypothetical protein VI583_03885 [Cyclobacteriaceae bacterium]|nr:hypothetical protein [Cyclobacteriaceae bacterium]
MKNYLLVIIPCLLVNPAMAQKMIEKHMNYSQGKSIQLNIQIADSIRIIPWEKNELYVRAVVNINDNQDNDIYTWTFNDTGSNIEVSAKMPEKEFWSDKNNDCCCNRMNVFCEIHIPENARYSVETINGNLILAGKGPDIRAKTISGFIDMTVPGTSGADLEFKTITGTVYTNFELKSPGKRHSGMTDFDLSVNGGGRPVSLETISGNIYLRKGN